MRKSLLGIVFAAALLPVSFADAATEFNHHIYATAAEAYNAGASLEQIFNQINENDYTAIKAAFDELIAVDSARSYNIYAAALSRLTSSSLKANLNTYATSRGLDSSVLAQINSNTGTGFKIAATTTGTITTLSLMTTGSGSGGGGGSGGCRISSTSVC